MVANTADSAQSLSDVQLWNNRIYTTWTDDRTGTTGIWANVLDWNNPVGISEKDISQIPSTYQLIAANASNQAIHRSRLVFFHGSKLSQNA